MSEAAVCICTDSSALLPADEAERLGIVVMPVGVTLDGEPFDERELGVDSFYERLGAGAVATTSQPSPGDFLEVYAQAAAGGVRSVLSLHLDGRVSGTVDSARLAAREAAIAVTVVDCGTVSFGVGVCARTAAGMLARGASATEAAEFAGHLGPRLRNAFVAPDGVGGRIGAGHGWTALTFTDGFAHPLATCATVDEAVSEMSARIVAGVDDLRAAVGHAGPGVAPASDALAAALADAPTVASVERYRVGAAVGAHTGPLSFGAFWWPATS